MDHSAHQRVQHKGIKNIPRDSSKVHVALLEEEVLSDPSSTNMSSVDNLKDDYSLPLHAVSSLPLFHGDEVYHTLHAQLLILPDNVR